MTSIAIIDDERYMLSVTESCIASDESLKRATELHFFGSAEEFIREWKRGLRVRILISDIEMPGMDGIEFGTVMREACKDIYLIFLTSHPEFALKSYEIDAYQYVLKETMETRLPEILQKLLLQIEKESREFRLIGTESNMHRIYFKHIIQIRKVKSGKYVEYITEKGNFKERISMGQLMTELDALEFIMVGRSNIVNIRHIDAIKGNLICLSNKEEIPISRAKAASVKRKIHERWRDF